MEFSVVSKSPDETIKLGNKLGQKLKGGEIIAISGPLGSGKTHLIKGIASGVGARNQKSVTSPTFVIINEYKGGRLDIYHVDAYRLDSIGEFEMLGFDELCYPGSVVLIEWANKIESALEGVDYIRIELLHLSWAERKISFEKLPDYIVL